MHISRGVFVCHVALHSIIYNSEPETRPERNPSKIIHIRTYSRRVIYAQNKCPTRSFFDQFCFSLYFFFFYYKSSNFYRHTTHSRNHRRKRNRRNWQVDVEPFCKSYSFLHLSTPCEILKILYIYIHMYVFVLISSSFLSIFAGCFDIPRKSCD